MVPSASRSGPPPLPESEGYVTRNHALASTTTWSLCAGALIVAAVDRPVRRVALSKVVSVRLEFAPTRPERNRFRCRLALQGGEVLEFYNRTYRGVYDFADTSGAYVALVRELHTQLAQHAPNCRFLGGVGQGGYVLNMAILVVLALVLVGALGFFLTVGLVWVALIKLLLIAFYTPAAIRWAKRNRPQTYLPGDIPASVLPELN